MRQQPTEKQLSSYVNREFEQRQRQKTMIWLVEWGKTTVPSSLLHAVSAAALMLSESLLLKLQQAYAVLFLSPFRLPFLLILLPALLRDGLLLRLLRQGFPYPKPVTVDRESVFQVKNLTRQKFWMAHTANMKYPQRAALKFLERSHLVSCIRFFATINV